jgi:hypothetical protein
VKLPRRQGWERPLPAAALTAGGMGAATGGAGGGLASSAFCKLNHCGQVGALPPPPREHFEKPKGSPILYAKYARKPLQRTDVLPK